METLLTADDVNYVTSCAVTIACGPENTFQGIRHLCLMGQKSKHIKRKPYKVSNLDNVD